MDEIIHARVALTLMTDPEGIAALESVLNEFQQDLQVEQEVFHAFRERTVGALELRDALFDLRVGIQGLHRRFQQRERKVSALYFSRLVPELSTETVIGIIRKHCEALDEVLFFLPLRRLSQEDTLGPQDTLRRH
jgi:hypothetical protein